MRDDQFVLIKRGQEPAKGIWTLPGGRVELGERLEDAAKREVVEECGLVIDHLKLLDVFEYIEPDAAGIRYHFVVVDYCARYKDGCLEAADDAEQARWVTLNDLATLDCSRTIKSLVCKAFKIDDTEVF